MTIACLRYPFDIKEVLRKRKSIRAELLQRPGLQDVKIALLGGSTTSEIRSIESDQNDRGRWHPPTIYVPVPLSATDLEATPLPGVTTRVADWLPVEVGLKRTVTAQDTPAES